MGTRLKETKVQSLKESIMDALAIVKAALTTFWFWVPVLFAVFLYAELSLMIINPLLLLIGPSILIVYALYWEEKRAKAQYGVMDAKSMHGADSMSATPQKISTQEEADELVEEYKKLLRKRPENPASADAEEKA